jgi:tetratricopeptide (TPR) repeat protein
MKTARTGAIFVAALMLLNSCAGVRVGPDTSRLFESFTQRALQFEKEDDLTMALNSWKVVGKLRPGNATAKKKIAALSKKLTHRARLHVQEGLRKHKAKDTSEARRQFLTALRCRPDYREALVGLHELLPSDYTTYTVTEATSLKLVAHSVYKDTKKAFLIAYFNDLDLNARLPAGSQIRLPHIDSLRAAAVFDSKNELIQTKKLLKNGKYEKALAAIEKILVYEPSNSAAAQLQNDALYAYGRALQNNKNYHDAFEVYSRVDHGYRNIGQTIADLKKTMLQEADAHYRQGVMYYVNEELAKAIHQWEQALDLDPGHPKAKKNIEKAKSLLEKLEFD